MKKRYFFIGFLLTFFAEIVGLIVFASHSSIPSQDTIAVNEVLQSVKNDFHTLSEHQNKTSLDYVVIDREGNLLYQTTSGLSSDIHSAIEHRDTILDITIENSVVGKVLIYNKEEEIFLEQKKTAIIILAVTITLQCGICLAYATYLHVTMIKPFHKLKGFAERVAGGNLDIPLEMDRRNLFGAFTESFDIMRSELKKARFAEAQAQKSKKELVAKLSHDIKTPIASIKAVSEVGFAVTNNAKDKENYTQIITKADQINHLITNLFTATLDELQQLSVTPTHFQSKKVQKILINADYLHRATIPEIPECLVYADELRLQQVFDNLFANSYKYANTEIHVDIERTEKYLMVAIEDFGGGVSAEELPFLKEKFKRGRNASQMEGAGLGLYISNYFMEEMDGELRVENGQHGLKVTTYLSLYGTI